MSEAEAVAPVAEAPVVEAPEAANDNATPETPVVEGSDLSTEQGQAMADALDGATEAGSDADGNRLYKVTVNGAEVEVSEDEMRQGYQRAAAAGAKFREAKQMRDQLEAEKGKIRQWAKRLKSSPFEALEAEGIDVRAAAEEYFSELLRKEQMTPAERKALEVENKLKQYEAQEAKRREAAKATTYQAEVKEYRARFEGELFAALDEAGISTEDRAAYVPQAAGLLQASLDAEGNTGLTVKDIAAHLIGEETARRERIIGGKWEELGGLEGDDLLGAIPEALQKRIQKAMLGKVKNPSDRGVRVAGKPRVKAEEQTPRKRITSIDEWREHYNLKR